MSYFSGLASQLPYHSSAVSQVGYGKPVTITVQWITLWQPASKPFYLGERSESREKLARRLLCGNYIIIALDLQQICFLLLCLLLFFSFLFVLFYLVFCLLVCSFFNFKLQQISKRRSRDLLFLYHSFFFRTNQRDMPSRQLQGK